MPENVAGTAGRKKKVILVVDDEELVRNYIKRIFTHAGYDVVSAGSGHDALALLQSFVVDLVVTDIRMPGMDGRELGTLITKLPQPPPVVYASASDRPPPGMEDCYIQKPFTATELTRIARAAMAQRCDPT